MAKADKVPYERKMETYIPPEGESQEVQGSQCKKTCYFALNILFSIRAVVKKGRNVRAPAASSNLRKRGVISGIQGDESWCGKSGEERKIVMLVVSTQ